MVYRDGVAPPKIVVVVFGNHVVGLEMATGKRIWSHDLFIEVSSPPRVWVGDTSVFVLGSELVCFDYLTGEERWRNPDIPKRCRSGTMLVFDDAVIIAGDGVAFCADAATGASRWHEKFSGLGGGAVGLAVPGHAAQGDG